MWKMVLLLLWISIGMSWAGYSSAYEEFIVPATVAKLFSTAGEVDSFLKTNQTPFGFYQAGVYYLYHAYGLINTLNVSSKDGKKLIKKAVEYLEKAGKLSSTEPMIFSMLGGAYLFSCQWGGVSDKIRNGRKGVFYMDKAVTMAPTNLRVRENRLRSFINLPPEFFPNVYKSIPEDADILLKNVEKEGSFYGDYAKELRSLCYYGKGLVAYYQKDYPKAREYLRQVEKGSSFVSNAETLLKRMGDSL